MGSRARTKRNRNKSKARTGRIKKKDLNRPLRQKTPTDRMRSVYYSPQGHWRGFAAINKLAKSAKVPKDIAKDWLGKQSIWQIYLPPPDRIPRPKFDIPVPNEVHQADLLFLPHDHSYKYALTVVDVASRYKEAEPLATKKADEVAGALSRIYERGPLKWPKLLQVDPGREFMGAVSKLLTKHGVKVRRGRANIHRDQGIVERFNRTLAERLFSHQYAQELLSAKQRSTEWTARLPAVIRALNNEETRLIGMMPKNAIKEKWVTQKPSSQYHRPVGFGEKRLPSNANVRYLYQPGELEGGKRRATDPIWSLAVYGLDKSTTKPDVPITYYLKSPAPQRGFVREELLVVPPSQPL